MPLSILIVPAAWTHYQAVLLIPLSLLALDLMRRRPVNWPAWGLLAFAYLLLMLPNPSMLYGGEIERNRRAPQGDDPLQRLLERGCGVQVDLAGERDDEGVSSECRGVHAEFEHGHVGRR